MRHHRSNRTLGREKKQRVALLRSLARSLVLEGKIKTTEARAKELRPFVEKMVTKAKLGTLAGRRLIASRINSEEAATVIFKDIAPKYKDTNGGYTRIVRLPRRKGDMSKMSVIEFV